MGEQTKLPVGIENFEEIRSNGYYYIDKTGLLDQILSSAGTKITLITRPRRFGKTLGMSMLEPSVFNGIFDQSKGKSCRGRIPGRYGCSRDPE